MTATATELYGADYFAVASHGYATSHIDALCHIFHDGKLYNGYAIERVTARGALDLGIHELRDGVVSRGVLLDAARARGLAFLEPGEPIFRDDLERAENESRVRVEEGDVLLVHTALGSPLPLEHGGPVRMITPQLYAWKGAKWIKAIEFLLEDRKGFWEERGYSNTALPWREDRYG